MTPNFIKEKFTRQKITHNLSLKILSLVVAIFLWLVVVNVTDPIVPQTYRNVPVKIINENVITDNGKTLEIVGDSAIIPVVTIKASRTIVQELGSSIDSIVATADMNSLSSDGTSVPIVVSTVKYSDKIDTIRSSVSTLYVNIENKKTIQLPLEATTSGEIESGYILGNIKPNQNQVRVSGPESVIEKIKSAKVDVQVTGFTEDISTLSEIVLFDAEDKAVSKENLVLNVDSVRVDAEILATKRVPIYYATSGIPADGYEATGDEEIVPETVIVAGSTSAIENINTISVPASELNITGQSGNMLAVLNLEKFLPEGIRLADPAGKNVSITVFIEPVTEDNYGVYLRNVSIENVPAGFDAEVVNGDDYVEFTLSGLAQNLEKVQLSMLNYRVDLDDYALLYGTTEFKPGTYTCYMVMDLPEGVESKEPVAIEIKLSKTGD